MCRCRRTSRLSPLCMFVLVWCLLFPSMISPALPQDAGVEFFESAVRPVLVEHCIRCHGDSRQNGGLRLDSRAAMMQGGESGPAAMSGMPFRSRMISAVERSEELAMPPEEELSERQIAVLKKWVTMGMPWPDTPPLRTTSDDKAAQHWAFQPVQNPDVPQVAMAAVSGHPLDAFVCRALSKAGLSPSPEADRRTLIRRLSYTLTGLPPSAGDVRSFVNDTSADAWENLVEHYLASPQYGEHWARHWLDVARYADTKGYVYGREERFWVHAWRYRDWVVDALNQDMSYRRFLLLQLAADQVSDARPQDPAAMGFLTVGRRFLGVDRDIIDDRIDVVTRGTMALTVSCARCHDHKYDPIPTADYYSLYGVFDSCAEQLLRIDKPDHGSEYEAELSKRQAALQQKLSASRLESSARVRSRLRDYLHAQTELHKYPAKGFDQVFEPTDLLPAFVRRWETWLRSSRQRHNAAFVPWHLFREIPADNFQTEAAAVVHQIREQSAGAVNPIVAAAFSTPPRDLSDVIDRYAAVLAEVDTAWQRHVRMAAAAGQDPPERLPDPAAEQLRTVLYGPDAPCEVPDEPIVHTESFFTTATCTAIWKLQGNVERWLIQTDSPPEYALQLTDRRTPAEPRIFRRGNPLNTGRQIPRQFLTVLSPERKPFQVGSGRLELAREIVADTNPLTARVIVNRVWAHHFGQGLVPTLSDFGLRSQAPSHPELLDWLATRLVADGWSLKSLHRLIVSSATFRQAVSGPDDARTLAKAVERDPGNRLLWRMRPRRLTFEQFRDSMLAATGELQLTMGGRPADLFSDAANVRRTLYGLVDRQFFPAVLRVFDFANPDLHVAERAETTVPQQALFFMNHPLVLQRAKRLTSICAQDTGPAETISAMFQSVLQREPTAEELSDALAVVAEADTDFSAPRVTAADWTYLCGRYNEDQQRVEAVQQLPHFTGEAWQGGSQWPDPKLGWVQLSAVGGHPGNTRDVASVRRWTAPRDMTVSIRSQLVHEPAAGDGIRAFIVSSGTGQLGRQNAHQSSAELNRETLEVQRGESIDFVVDIDKVLNSDQYLWKVVIAELPGSAANTGAPQVWDSAADFPNNAVQRLSPLEQLAQVLFCANEFLFVD